MEYKLPPLPTNLPNVVRRIRACEGEVAAQVVFEHALNEYAIAAIEAQGVPDGWQLVPKEPTDEMVRAALHLDLSYMPGHDGPDRAAVYKAMLASAPPAPQGERTALEQYDLEQSTDYRKGWDDGRMKGYEVGVRHGKEQHLFSQASVVQQEPVAKIVSAGDAHGKVEWLVHSGRPIRIGQALYTHPAQQALTPCNCRWDGETQAQQCTLHKAHVEAIHEWAERAKTAEKTLSAQQAKPLSDEQQIAEALRRHGLALVKKASGYDVMKLGECTAHGIQGS